MTLAADTRLGQYEILSPLGAGGMGQVYRAQDLRLDRQIAIKVLPPKTMNDPVACRRFEQEARSIDLFGGPRAGLRIFRSGQTMRRPRGR